jgi:hypothetical protein
MADPSEVEERDDEDEDEDEVVDAIETAYLRASGFAANDCAYVGQRFSQRWGYRARDSESWVLRHAPGADGGALVSHHHPTDTRYADVWLSPARQVFVADATLRCVHRATLAPTRPDAWTRDELPMAVQGVFGLADEFVVAWGGVGEAHPMARFDGRAWAAMADPGFEVYAVHGVTADNLVAVGEAGQVARFDGGRWQRFPTPVSEVLTGVFMASVDEVYVTGARGALLEGSLGGFAQIAQAEVHGAFPLLDVAWWRGELWIAGGRLGLLRRVGRGDALEVVDNGMLGTGSGPTRLDARRDLVVTYRDRVAGTADGKAWARYGRDSLGAAYDGRRLHFYR